MIMAIPMLIIPMPKTRYGSSSVDIFVVLHRGNPDCSSRKQSETLEIWTIFGNIGDEKLSAVAVNGKDMVIHVN